MTICEHVYPTGHEDVRPSWCVELHGAVFFQFVFFIPSLLLAVAVFALGTKLPPSAAAEAAAAAAAAPLFASDRKRFALLHQLHSGVNKARVFLFHACLVKLPPPSPCRNELIPQGSGIVRPHQQRSRAPDTHQPVNRHAPGEGRPGSSRGHARTY